MLALQQPTAPATLLPAASDAACGAALAALPGHCHMVSAADASSVLPVPHACYSAAAASLAEPRLQSARSMEIVSLPAPSSAAAAAGVVASSGCKAPLPGPSRTCSSTAAPLSLPAPVPVPVPAPATSAGGACAGSPRGVRAVSAPGGTSPSNTGYSTDSYWNTRYAERSTHFDWFFTYNALKGLIGATCTRPEAAVLHIGCGNSGLSAGMVDDGFQHVVSTDISPVVVDQMRQQHPGPQHRWEVADCRAMPQYATASFGAVVDKGTLDAVLCCHTGQADAAAYVQESHRLLSPGGMFLLITLGQPSTRMALLNATGPAGPAPPAALRRSSSPDVAPGSVCAASSTAAVSSRWTSVELYLLPKPSLYLATEASLLGKPQCSPGGPTHDKDEPVAWVGPFAPEDLDREVAAQQLQLHQYFFAYACTKAAAEEATAEATA